MKRIEKVAKVAKACRVIKIVLWCSLVIAIGLFAYYYSKWHNDGLVSIPDPNGHQNSITTRIDTASGIETSEFTISTYYKYAQTEYRFYSPYALDGYENRSFGGPWMPLSGLTLGYYGKAKWTLYGAANAAYWTGWLILLVLATLGFTIMDAILQYRIHKIKEKKEFSEKTREYATIDALNTTSAQ